MKKIILLIIVLIITGCTNNHKSIDNLAIISTMGIDVVDNEYIISVEILNPTKKTNKDSLDYNIETVKGSAKTLTKAIDNINAKTSKELYLNHLELLIIGKDSLKYIDNIASYFVHDNMINKDFYIYYSTEEEASKIIYDDSNKKDDNKASHALLSSFLRPNSNTIKFKDFLKIYLNPYTDSYIPIIKVNNTKTDESIILSDLLITSDFNKNYILKGNDAIITNALNKKIASSIYTFTYKDFLYTFDNTYDKINITPSFIDNEPYITINVSITASILESENTDIKFTNNSINDIKKALNKSVEARISKLVSKLIINKTDVLGFSDKFYNEYPKFMELNDTKTLLSNLNIIVDVDSSITDFSLLKND